MNTFGGIKRELMSDYGSLRKCEYCEWAVVKTYFISGMNLCNACAEKTGAKESEFTKDTKVTFGSCSNAKFKCPGKLSRQNCGANALTFRDLILGTCCEAAANGTQNIGDCDRLKFVEKYLNMAKKKLQEAEEHAKEADELAAKALKNFEEVRHDFKDVMIDTQDYIDDNSASDRQMCEGPMRIASDSIKSIIGMELNISELTRNGAAEANRTKNYIENECVQIKRRHDFLSASQEKIRTDSIAPVKHDKPEKSNVTRVRKLR